MKYTFAISFRDKELFSGDLDANNIKEAEKEIIEGMFLDIQAEEDEDEE